VKNSFRILFAVALVTLLVAVIGIGSIMAKQIDVSTLGKTSLSSAPAALTVVADTVEWTASNGDDVTHVKPGTTAVFYINDDALETTKAGVATFSGQGATTRFFDVPGNAAGTNSGTATPATSTLSATDYSTTTSALTPWIGAPVVTAGGSVVSSSSYDPSAGTVTLLADTGTGTTTVSFTYHLVDVWGTSTSANRRAKVVSTSDSQGEFVLISEVASVGSSAADPDSRIFRGAILLSSDAATQGTNSDGVWVQDGDVLTVTYLKSDGTALDSDTIAVDAVKPTVTAITPADDTISGIKNPYVSFEVTDAGAGIASNPSTAITLAIFAGGGTTTIPEVRLGASSPSYQPIANGFRVIFTQPESWLGGGTGGFGASDGTAFTWTLTATDKAGNSTSITNDLTIDITKPTVNSALTGTSYDTSTEKETTGKTDSVKVTFSEDVDASSASTADFTVGGATPAAVIVGTKAGDRNNVYLTVGTLAPNAKPEVIVTGVLTDKAGNVVDVSSSVTTNKVSASDGLKPGITSTVSLGLAVKDDKVKVTVTSDEKLGTSGLIVSIIGPSGSTNKSLTTTAPTNPLVREGEYTIPAGNTGMYGVSIQGTDLGNNVSNNLTKVTAEAVSATNISVSAGNTVVTLGKGPIGDNSFDGLVTAADISSLTFSANAATTAQITAVDASARTITLAGTAVGATETATVTYWYASTEFIEIDNSAPAIVDTLLFDPSDGASTINRTPFISVKWDENEYPGDSKTTVTLTKASLKAPDGTETDILSLMSTTDNKTFFYRPIENMAIGKYTLTVKAKDIAGNESADQAAKLEIKEKSKTKVALLPGWNLVSIPGTPSDTAINVVITPPEIDTVLSFDASTAGGWLTAIRDTESGMLVGTLTDITATRAYWVHTTNDSPIEVDIAGVEAGSAQLPPALSLAKGWNLVPAVSLSPSFTSIDADTYLSGLKWSKGYSYDRKLGQFVSFIPQAAATADTCLDEGGAAGTAGNCIDAGLGYWIYLTESGVLIP